MPSVLEPPQIRSLTQDRQSTLVHRIAVNVMRLAMLVAIAGIFGAGWYLAKRGFGREWRYRQVEGIFFGIQISATGQLINLGNYKPSPLIPEEERRKRRSIAQRVVNELQKFSLPATSPSLQVKFSGDIADIETARVDARVRGD